GQRRQRGAVARVAHARAQPAQRAPEHGGAGRPVGLRHAVGHDEAGDDEHPAGASERARRTQRAAWLKERADTARTWVERQEVINRIERDSTNGHGAARYHSPAVLTSVMRWP